MPCEGPRCETVYRHGDGCRCPECAKYLKWMERQTKLRLKYTPIYIEKLKKLNLKSVIGIFHFEYNRDAEYQRNYGGNYIETFKDWLNNCRTFPEKLEIKTFEAFGFNFIFTHHVHEQWMDRP